MLEDKIIDELDKTLEKDNIGIKPITKDYLLNLYEETVIAYYEVIQDTISDTISQEKLTEYVEKCIPTWKVFHIEDEYLKSIFTIYNNLKSKFIKMPENQNIYNDLFYLEEYIKEFIIYENLEEVTKKISDNIKKIVNFSPDFFSILKNRSKDNKEILTLDVLKIYLEEEIDMLEVDSKFIQENTEERRDRINSLIKNIQIINEYQNRNNNYFCNEQNIKDSLFIKKYVVNQEIQSDTYEILINSEYLGIYLNRINNLFLRDSKNNKTTIEDLENYYDTSGQKLSDESLKILKLKPQFH